MRAHGAFSAVDLLDMLLVHRAPSKSSSTVRVRSWPVLRAMMDLGFGYAAAWSTLVGCQFHGKSSSIRLAG